MSEERLNQLKQNEDGIVSSILEKYMDKVYSLCLNMLNLHHDAEDACNETFYNVIRDKANIPNIKNMNAWIMRIASNVCINKLRRDKKFVKVDFDASALDPKNFEPAAINAEKSEKLLKSVKNLPYNYRTAILLRFQQGLEYNEIAEIMDVSYSNVRVLIFRGLALLRKKIRDLE